MADLEHFRILKQGVKAWNEWRDSHPYVRPDLREVNLQEIDIRNAYLAETDLSRVDFSGRDLSGMHLDFADLTEAKFNNANLTKANLRRSIFFRADLIESNLEGAELQAADFRQAYLMKANLKGIYLGGVDFTHAALTRADLSGSILNSTVFGENYLDEVIGLDLVTHNGPSIIGIATIYRSRGNIPESFLRGCGLPDSFIAQIPTLLTHLKSSRFYSCFISYSSKDRIFAEKLYSDLQSKGVRCWLDSKNLKVGEKTRTEIDKSIQSHDRVLVILSKHSIKSEWVEQEVETALAIERKEKRNIILPVTLDKAEMKTDIGWPAFIKNTRNIGDFRRWKKPDVYKELFNGLLRSLEADDSAESRA